MVKRETGNHLGTPLGGPRETSQRMPRGTLWVTSQ